MKKNTLATFCIRSLKENSLAQLANYSLPPLDLIPPNEMIIANHYSSLNYKDALGILNKGKIFHHFPMIAGIDGAGVVIHGPSTSQTTSQIGKKVLVTGCGLGEDRDGGLASHMIVPESWVIPIPDNWSMEWAMMLGTAGFTAALAIHQMEHNGLSKNAPILVTGSSGGVGLWAVKLLSKKGYEVIAATGKNNPDTKNILHHMGAHTVTTIEGLQLGQRFLEKGKFAGAIDNIGGETLGPILAHIQLGGCVASIGLAAGPIFKTSVMPFILRGVNLLGVSSTNAPLPLRKKIWQDLSELLTPEDFHHFPHKIISLEDVIPHCEKFMDRSLVGRLVVKFQDGNH
jgi:acrylyl-CoA reductase (NADPH)